MDFQSFNAQIIDEFRSNAGVVGGQFAGAPLLLLTTTGAKTGRQLTSPLVYIRDGDRYVVIASKGGADTNPAWYHNVLANPGVTLEIGEETFEAKAAPAEGAERDRLYKAQADQMPQFWEYQEKTSRVIPVVVLEPVT